MIQIALDPLVLAAEACLAVLVFDLFRWLRSGWRDGHSDDPEHSLSSQRSSYQFLRPRTAVGNSIAPHPMSRKAKSVKLTLNSSA
jgi:hypothetical protein